MKNSTYVALILMAGLSCKAVIASSTDTSGGKPVLVASGISKDFDPENRRFFSISTQDLTIATSLDKSGNKLVVDRSGSLRQADLPIEIVQIDKAYAGDKHITLFSRVSSSVSAVTVINQLDMRVVQHFYCYNPTMSPSGQYVAYHKFYPPHSGQDIPLDPRVYEVGSLSLEPGSAGPDLAIKSAKQFSNVTILNMSQMVNVLSNFYWSQDSTSFAFYGLGSDGVKFVRATVNSDKDDVYTMPKGICSKECSYNNVSDVEVTASGLSVKLTSSHGKISTLAFP